MPTTLTGLLLLVVILLPGITYVAIRERKTPEQRRSAFRETATVATVSIVANIAALGIFALARILLPDITPNVGGMVREPESYVRENYASVSLWSLALFALAIGLAAIGAALMGKRSQHPSTTSAWWLIFDQWRSGVDIHVSCVLDDGSWVEGRLGSFNQSADDIADRDLILDKAIKFAYSPKDDAKPQEVTYACVSARRIVTLFASYLPSGYADQQAEAEES